MNLDYIREFCALADVKKYSEAAEICYVSQSALSKHIKSLEKELGFPLFHRTAHVVMLTDLGEAFLPYAKELGETRLKCESNLLSKVRSEAKTLTVGLSPLVSPNGMLARLNPDRIRADDYSVVFHHHHSEHLRQLLITGRADVIVTGDQESEDESRFHVLPYYADRLCFVCSHGVNLTRTNADQFTYVQIGNDCYYALLFHRFRRPDFQAPNAAMAFGMLRSFQGFTICTEAQVKYLLTPELRCQEAFQEVPIHFNLMYSLPSLNTPHAEHILSFIRQISEKAAE